MRQLSGQCTVKAISRQLGCSRFQTRKITAKSCDLKLGGGGGGGAKSRKTLFDSSLNPGQICTACV